MAQANNNTGPQLNFSFENAKQQPVIYITNDPTLNKLTFSLVNLSSKSLNLRGGTPVSENNQSSTGPSALYLTFGSLLTTQELSQLDFKASGWQATFFNTGMLTNWALTPSQNISIPSLGAVQFSVSKLVANSRPTSGFLTVDYYNLGSLSNGSQQLKLLLQNPPIAGLKDLQLNIGISGSNQVMTTLNPGQPIRNQLSFFLNNPDLTQPIVDPSTPWENDPPVFILSFVEGMIPGYGAIAETAAVTNFSVSAQQNVGTSWKVVPHTSGPDPSWALMPQDHRILGVGQASTIEFSIDDIVTDFQPGLTPLYLQYANIPGYNDGYLSLVIRKDFPPEITELITEPSFVTLQQTPVQPTVRWKVEHDKALELRSSIGSFNVMGSNSWQSPQAVDESINFTLHAEGPGKIYIDRQVRFRVLDFQVKPNVVTSSISQIAFVAYSQLWSYLYFLDEYSYFYVFDPQSETVLQKMKLSTRSSPYGIFLSSTLSTKNERVYVTVYGQGQPGELLALDVNSRGQINLAKRMQFPGNQVFDTHTIAPTADGRHLYFTDYKQNALGYLTVSNFSYQYVLKGLKPANSALGTILLSKDGKILYGGSYEGVHHFDLVNNTYLGLIKVNININGFNLHLSPQGDRLYVPGNNNISVIYLDDNNRVEDISVNGFPFDVAISSDGSVVYAAIIGGQLAVIDADQLQVDTYVDIPHKKGTAYRSIALSPGDDRVFMGNDQPGNALTEILITEV